MDTHQAFMLLGISRDDKHTFKEVTDAYMLKLAKLHEAFSIVINATQTTAPVAPAPVAPAPVAPAPAPTPAPAPALTSGYRPFNLKKFIELEAIFVMYLRDQDLKVKDKETLIASLSNNERNTEGYAVVAEKIWYTVIQDPICGINNTTGIGIFM